MLLEGYQGMKQQEKQIPPQGKVRLAQAAERLVQLYEALGDQEQAEQWRSKLKAEKSEPGARSVLFYETNRWSVAHDRGKSLC